MADTEIEAPAPTHNSSTATNGRKGKKNVAAKEDQHSGDDSPQFILLGTDISHLKREHQYAACTLCLFSFSLLYGYLQELISVQIFSRDLALFLSTVQFTGYTLLVYLLRVYVYPTIHANKKVDSANGSSVEKRDNNVKEVPPQLYLSIALLRALELGLTNLGMQYLNYPAKTLLKSSRIVFIMLFGMFIQRKKYQVIDFLTVFGMVVGLALFLHADSKSAAVFHYIGVLMLLLSLFCDGAIVNISESIMTNYGVGQDEFIVRVYSIALVAVTIAGALIGDLDEGLLWMSEPGTYKEFVDNVPIAERTWSVPGKIAVLAVFSATGFFALSCCSALTKNFGALTMSVTSTTRKATTLFLSFLLFDNVFTVGHFIGIGVFIPSLLVMAMSRREADNNRRNQIKRKFSGVELNNTKANRQASAKGHGKEKDSLTLRHGAAAAP